MPLLQESYRRELYQEAEQFTYQPDVKVIGTGDRMVRTEYSACEIFPNPSLYVELMSNFQRLMDRAIDSLSISPFRTPLCFNSMVLQHYEPGQLGITPHRDSLRAINLICIINIGGQADLYRCDDRRGANSVQIDTTPGNGVFMQAPGFRKMSLAEPSWTQPKLTRPAPTKPDSTRPEFIEAADRPFHYITNVRSTRYSLGLRQYISRSDSKSITTHTTPAAIVPSVQFPVPGHQ